MKICVHSGRFHADDVLGVALAALELGVVPDVVRTRDPAGFADADLVLDVGERFDGRRFFDHHQPNDFAYPNGVRMAACGLYLQAVTSLEGTVKRYLLEQGLFKVQALDNMQDVDRLGLGAAPNPFTFVETLNNGWGVSAYKHGQDVAFNDAVRMVVRVLRNMVRDARVQACADAQVAAALRAGAADGWVDIGNHCPWEAVVVGFNAGAPSVRAVVYTEAPNRHVVHVVPRELGGCVGWCTVPEVVSVISSFVFRHDSGSMAVFSTHLGAVTAARLTVS